MPNAKSDDDGPWVLVVRDGRLKVRRPYCDCTKKGHGYTRRSDGAWVRPCCMRREHAAWEKHGDGPIEHDPTTCRFCLEGSESEHHPHTRKASL